MGFSFTREVSFIHGGFFRSWDFSFNREGFLHKQGFLSCMGVSCVHSVFSPSLEFLSFKGVSFTREGFCHSWGFHLLARVLSFVGVSFTHESIIHSCGFIYS